MSRDFQKELEGFDKVWKRVARERLKMPENIRLMPRRDKGGGSPDRRGK